MASGQSACRGPQAGRQADCKLAGSRLSTAGWPTGRLQAGGLVGWPERQTGRLACGQAGKRGRTAPPAERPCIGADYDGRNGRRGGRPAAGGEAAGPGGLKLCL